MNENGWTEKAGANSIVEWLRCVTIAFMLYRRVTTAVNDIERRHVAPLTAKVNSILGDVQAVTARVQTQAARVDSAISETMDRVDSTAARVKYTMRDRMDQIAAVVHAFREVVGSLFERRAANY